MWKEIIFYPSSFINETWKSVSNTVFFNSRKFHVNAMTKIRNTQENTVLKAILNLNRGILMFPIISSSIKMKVSIIKICIMISSLADRLGLNRTSALNLFLLKQNILRTLYLQGLPPSVFLLISSSYANFQ